MGPRKILKFLFSFVHANLDFSLCFACFEFLISKVLLFVNKCKFTQAASLTPFPCNQMWKLHPPFWIHDNYTFQHAKNCLCFSCWNEKAETLSKIYYYIKDHFHNCFLGLQSNHDQGSFSLKKNILGNMDQMKLTAKFHLNGHSLIL